MGRRASNGRISLITCTCTTDGIDHLVSDEAEGVTARQGIYLALFGQLIPAATLTSPGSVMLPLRRQRRGRPHPEYRPAAPPASQTMAVITYGG
jgi:hypothetical protein